MQKQKLSPSRCFLKISARIFTSTETKSARRYSAGFGTKRWVPVFRMKIRDMPQLYHRVFRETVKGFVVTRLLSFALFCTFLHCNDSLTRTKPYVAYRGHYGKSAQQTATGVTSWRLDSSRQHDVAARHFTVRQAAQRRTFVFAPATSKNGSTGCRESRCDRHPEQRTRVDRHRCRRTVGRGHRIAREAAIECRGKLRAALKIVA